MIIENRQRPLRHAFQFADSEFTLLNYLINSVRSTINSIIRYVKFYFLPSQLAYEGKQACNGTSSEVTF